MLEEARKLSKIFYSLERLTSFLKRDYSAQLSISTADNDKYVKQKISEFEEKLTNLRGITFSLGGGEFNKQKLTLYIHYLLLTYLKNQSGNLLQDCNNELAMLRNDFDIDVQRYKFEQAGVRLDSEVERLAQASVKKVGDEYIFLNEVINKLLREIKSVTEQAYRNFRDSNSFILGSISKETMGADIAIERIGELLHLPEVRFEKVMEYAENAAIHDDSQNYMRPDLTVHQLVILYDALREAKVISPDVPNKVLGKHIGSITGHSGAKLGREFSNIRKFINDNKNSRDANDAETVKEYLILVKNAIDKAIASGNK